MRLRIKSKETWIDIGDGTRVLVRSLPMFEAIRIGEKHTKRQIVEGIPVEVRDGIGLMRDLWKYRIRDWTGMLDEEGQDVPFSETTLMAALNHDPEFVKTVEAKLSELEALERGFKDEESENL